MRYFGKVCDKHPERKGERNRFPSGRTVCIDCHYLRNREWIKNDLVTQKKLKEKRKTREYLDKFNAYRRMKRIAAPPAEGV
jgi:hypothetical protein